jgi:hypothetical protein
MSKDSLKSKNRGPGVATRYLPETEYIKIDGATSIYEFFIV